jgi:hypothetical protein
VLTRITEETFECLLHCFESASIVELRDVAFIDPYGMISILEIGEYLQSRGIQKNLVLPESEEVLKYLERMDFFSCAERYFGFLPGKPVIKNKYLRNMGSDVLLEITPIIKSDDIHYIVGKVKERSHSILTKHLHYDENAINHFIVSLSEICQNIIEHSECKGFVGIQKYHFQNLNKNMAKIAVMDIGRGFRGSLSERFSLKSDSEAIGKGLLHGASRFVDKGRGHGLSAVRRFVKHWNGKLSIRSGTAKLSIIPGWAKGKTREQNLRYFPGAQINILLPEV